jgi:hypothetical protein
MNFLESESHMKPFAITCLAVVLGLSMGATQAASSTDKAAPAKQATSPVKKAPVKQAATSKGVPAKTAKAVEANTPVQTLSERLTDAELEISKTIQTGRIQCELGADVTVSADEKNPGFFHVVAGKQRYYMHPVESRTGAVRMEDNRAGAMWLQLGNKSMLMNQRLGQRIADECVTPAQRDFALQMKTSNQPGLLDGPSK